MPQNTFLEELLKELPETMRQEVYDFASYLLRKHRREEEKAWNAFSLAQALQGLDDEDLYTEADLKERWTSNREK